MLKPTINFIGCGRLGQTLAHLWHANGMATIQSIYTRESLHSEKAIAFIGAGIVCDEFCALKLADIYCFACSDDAIEPLCEALLAEHAPPANSVFVHFSGAHTSILFEKAKFHGVRVASVHPMHSFADPQISVHNFAGTLCAFDGDAGCKKELENLFAGIDARLYAINAEMKTLYHIAGVFSSNFLPLLAQCAYTCLQKAAVPDELIPQIVSQLMHNTLGNIQRQSAPGVALTGPLARGDVKVIENHLQHLAQHTDYAPLYALLSAYTLALTSHDTALKQRLEAVLVNYPA